MLPLMWANTLYLNVTTKFKLWKLHIFQKNSQDMVGKTASLGCAVQKDLVFFHISIVDKTIWLPQKNWLG